MAREIAVDTGILNSDIQGLNTQLELIKRDLDKMYNSVNYLDSMWDGPSNEAFVAHFRQDKEDMAALCNILQELIHCLGFARQEYDRCENEVNGIVSSIPI